MDCGKCGNSLSHLIGKNFVKVTFLLKKLEITKELISRNVFPRERISGFIKFRESNIFTKEVNKEMISRIFFDEIEFLVFPHYEM